MKELTITDYDRDTGYCRYAVYSERVLVLRTNDRKEMLLAVARFFVKDKEPD